MISLLAFQLAELQGDPLKEQAPYSQAVQLLAARRETHTQAEVEGQNFPTLDGHPGFLAVAGLCKHQESYFDYLASFVLELSYPLMRGFVID